MAIHTGSKLGLEIMEALGIDSQRVVSIKLILEAGDIAKVEVVRAVSVDDGERLIQKLSSYILVPADE